jgi:hypothetical protein
MSLLIQGATSPRVGIPRAAPDFVPDAGEEIRRSSSSQSKVSYSIKYRDTLDHRYGVSDSVSEYFQGMSLLNGFF